MKKEDLIPGKIYFVKYAGNYDWYIKFRFAGDNDIYANSYIECDSYGKYNITTEAGWPWGQIKHSLQNIREVSPKEQQWYEECMKTGKSIPLENYLPTCEAIDSYEII